MEIPSRAPVDLSVSIVVYHSDPGLLQRTLDSLHESAREALDSGYLRGLSVHLVDNSADSRSSDAVKAIVSAWHHQAFCPLQYSGTGENKGFGAGNNLVLPGLESDCHLILNPDVELGREALSRGLARLQGDGSVALVSPRACADNGEQEFLCKRYPSAVVLLLRGFAPAFIRGWFASRLEHYEMRDSCGSSRMCEVPLASGCFMLVRTNALQRVGGFDERYFLYFEDFDLSLRLASEGRLVYDPAVRIVHHGGYAASKGLRHVGLFLRSAVRFFNDHGWRWI